jgi:hypothetical protein
VVAVVQRKSTMNDSRSGKGREGYSVGFAPIARLVYLIIIGVTIASIWQLSFGWSLGETTKFATVSIGADYAKYVSYLVQFGPNIFFLLVPLVKNGAMRKVFVFLAVGLNLIDATTNIGAYSIYRQGVTNPANVAPWVGDMANAIGWILCLLVTWGEEAMIYLVGLAFQVFANLLEDTGRTPPAWFRADIVKYASAASGADAVGLGYGRERRERSPENGGHWQQAERPHREPQRNGRMRR